MSMSKLHWSIETEPSASLWSVYEYLLCDEGIFVKEERREKQNVLSIFMARARPGFQAVKGRDYNAAPYSRNALLWYKLTAVHFDEAALQIRLFGNRATKIVLQLPDGAFAAEAMAFIEAMRQSHPLKREADEHAARWLCWSEDDEWEEPLASLERMIELEKAAPMRFIEDALEETCIEAEGHA